MVTPVCNSVGRCCVAIRRSVKLFDPEGVELGCASTTLRLLPAGGSAPWGEPESYYFWIR